MMPIRNDEPVEMIRILNWWNLLVIKIIIGLKLVNLILKNISIIVKLGEVRL